MTNEISGVYSTAQFTSMTVVESLAKIYTYSGTYSQQFGSWNDLTGLSIVYIAMTVSVTNTGTSYVYAYLEVHVLGISTLTL